MSLILFFFFLSFLFVFSVVLIPSLFTRKLSNS
jgi:hypothetical protein